MPKRRLWNTRVFYRYFLTNLALFCLPAVLTGLFLFNNTVQKLDTEIKNLQQYKLDKAEEDLNSQFDNFSSIALNIAINPDLKPSFFLQNPYNEYLMVRNFKKYIDQSQIAGDILFVQKDSGYLYNIDGKYYRWVYFDKILGMSSFTETLTEIDNTINPVLKKLSNNRGDDIFLYVYPISTINIAMDRKDTAIVFIIKPEDFYNRVNLVAGGFDGDLHIYWHDNLIYGNSGNSDKNSTVLYGSGSAYSIRCTLQLFSVKYSEPVAKLRIIYGWVIFAISALSLFLCFLIAYNHYKPVKSLENHINEQNQQLQFDALNLLVSGSKEPEIEYYHKLGISLEAPNYCIMLLKPVNTGSGPEKYHRLYSQIKKTVEENNFIGITSYLFEPDYKDNILTLICGLGKDWAKTRRNYAEYLRNIFYRENYEIKIACGSVYDSPSKLGNSMIEAMTTIQYTAGNMADVLYFDELANVSPVSFENTSTDLMYLMQSIKLGNLSSSVTALENIIKKIMAQENTQMIRQCMIYDVINSILKTAINLKMDVSQVFLSRVTAIKNPEELASYIIS